MRMISRTTDKMLVKNVKTHSCLFERQDENFKNNVAKDAAWLEVATACNAPAEYCRLRWVYLRSKYSRVIKLRAKGSRVNWPLDNEMMFLQKYIIQRGQRQQSMASNQNETLPSASSDNQSSMPYDGNSDAGNADGTEMNANKQENEYHFNDYLMHPDHSTDVDDIVNSSINSTSNSNHLDTTVTSPSNIATKFAGQNGANDEDNLFGRTIGAMLKKLDPITKNMARIKILTFVGGLQLGQNNADLF